MRAWLTILVLCTFAGAILSIGDYAIISFSFSKDQNITFFLKQMKIHYRMKTIIRVMKYITLELRL